MFDEIDFKAMLEQDSDFREYVKETLLFVTLAQDNGSDLLKSVNAFYNIGTSPRDVGRWVKNARKQKRDYSDECDEIAVCSCDCHVLTGRYQPNHCSLC